MIYRKTSNGYLCSKSESDTYVSETNITTYAVNDPSALKLNNGLTSVIYRRSLDNYIVMRIKFGAWSGESILIASGVGYTSTINKQDNSLLISYIRSSDNYLVSITRSVTPVNASVTGHTNTPISVTLNGPSTNPRIINNDTLEYIWLNTTLSTGDYFVVNTAFGQKTVDLYSGGIRVNGLAYLDLGSTFFDLSPGSNTVYYEDDAVASTATATMEWTERYIGV
jgi:hypothetical protein